MRPVPQLQSETDRSAWKSLFRALLRKYGRQQKEVALEMARLVSVQTGRFVQDNAFISAISRFANGRDSAFPGWFYKEETRLLPLAQAIGLPSTEELWDLLQKIGQPQRNAGPIWHPAFPDNSITVPSLLNGKSIDVVADGFVHRIRLQGSSDLHPAYWIVGKPGSGKTFAAVQLQESLRQRGYEFEIVTPSNYSVTSPQIIMAEQAPKSFPHVTEKATVDLWGAKELASVVSGLSESLSAAQLVVANGFVEQARQNIDYLGSDRRPFEVLFVLDMVIRKGLPRTPADSRIMRLQDLWDRAKICSPVLQLLSITQWAQLWALRFAKCWDESWYKISSGDLAELFHQVFQDKLSTLQDRDYALQLITTAKGTSKRSRDQALDKLDEWIRLSTVEHLRIQFVQAGLLVQEHDNYVATSHALSWACWGLVLQKTSGIEHDWSRLTRPSLAFVVKELAILGLSEEQFRSDISNAPSWARIDVATAVIHFAAHTTDRLPKEAVLQAWADCLLGEAHRVFWYPESTANQNLPASLQIVSLKYVVDLPRLSFADPIRHLREYVSKAALQIIDFWAMPPVRDIQSLSPLQFPPNSMQDWSEWKVLPPKGLKAWEVLHQRALIGDDVSARFLSEGDARVSHLWSAVPLAVRLQWFCTSEVYSSSAFAFQLLAVEVWSHPNVSNPELLTQFSEAAKRLGKENLMQSIDRWAHPLALAQQLQQYADDAKLAFCALYLAYESGENGILLGWMQTILQWMQTDIVADGMIQYHGQKIPQRNLNIYSFHQTLLQFCLQAADFLYQLGHKDELRNLWHHPPKKIQSLQWKEKAFDLLVSHLDDYPIAVWISSAPQVNRTMNALLLGERRLLQKAWRLDRRANRRQEILQLAAMQKEIPSWAILATHKKLSKDFIWPLGFSPYREECLPLVRTMLKACSEPNRIWWATLIHRHQPWPKELIDSLRFWLTEDEQPFARRSVSVVQDFEPNVTPGLSVEEHFFLLKSFIKQERPNWLTKGINRLWNLSAFGSSTIVLMIAEIMIQVGPKEKLLQPGWRKSKGRLHQLLSDQWLLIASKEELRAEMQKGNSLGLKARKRLLELGDEQTIQYTISTFLTRTDPIAFQDLAQTIPNRVLGLLQLAAKNKPHMKALLSQIACSALVYLPETDTEIRAWIRSVSIE